MPELDLLTQSSVQSNDLETVDNAPVHFGFLNWVARAGETISPWWSPRRDKDLRVFPLGSDHLSGTLYAIVARLSTIPFKVVPKDPTIDRHVKVASFLQDSLENWTSFGEGWNYGYGQFIYDMLNQDNGGYLEVLGKGNPAGPIEGLPYGVNHLDSALCTRTRNPEYPVVYTNTKGDKYMLHYTRVISVTSMPSADIEMNGVGFCATSRAINTGQHLMDISVFEQEKLGSRPLRGMLVGSKVSSRDLAQAIYSAESQMDNQSLSRFAKLVLLGSANQEIAVDLVDFAKIPDGYDKQSSTQLGMAAIALAFGVDLRELWPATITGATKADASLQHMKARGKAIGELLQITKRKFEQKFLPPYLTLVHDYTDDEEDMAQASIMGERATSYETLLNARAMTERIVRERLLLDGTITEIQFETMELDSGRLKDGEPVIALFQSADAETRQMLSGINPDSASEESINSAIKSTTAIYINTSSDRLKRKAAACLAALNSLIQGEENETDQRSIPGVSSGQPSNGASQRHNPGGRTADPDDSRANL